jgi:hypothetical protein
LGVLRRHARLSSPQFRFLVSGFWFAVSAQTSFAVLVSGFWFLVCSFWFLVCSLRYARTGVARLAETSPDAF